jgi:hypothetical protein
MKLQAYKWNPLRSWINLLNPRYLSSEYLSLTKVNRGPNTGFLYPHLGPLDTFQTTFLCFRSISRLSSEFDPINSKSRLFTYNKRTEESVVLILLA